MKKGNKYTPNFYILLYYRKVMATVHKSLLRLLVLFAIYMEYFSSNNQD